MEQGHLRLLHGKQATAIRLPGKKGDVAVLGGNNGDRPRLVEGKLGGGDMAGAAETGEGASGRFVALKGFDDLEIGGDGPGIDGPILALKQ
jgi:hypothetical protein